MAHKKAGGSAKNLNDSKPKYLGIKLYAGEIAHVGDIVVRQRGTAVLPGKNVKLGKDHTIFAIKEGVVSFRSSRKIGFDGHKKIHRMVDVQAK